MAQTLHARAIITAVDRISGPLTRMAGRFAAMKGRLAGMTRVGDSVANAGRRASVGMTLPAIAAVKFSANLQDALLEWKKAEDELGTPKGMAIAKRQIKEMSNFLPLSQVRLANLATAAALAGVSFKETAGFVTMAAKASAAFNLAAEDAGSQLAGIKSSAGLSNEALNALLGRFDLLENNMNVRGRQLIDFTNRIGALSRAGGFANKEIAAVGATMIDAGVATERAATGFKNIVRVLVNPNPKKFGPIGLVAEEFKALAHENPIKALNKLRLTINALPGKDRAGHIFEIFKDQAAPAVMQLFQNWEKLNKALDLVSDEAKAKVQLDKAFDITMEGLNRKFATLRNSILNVVDTMVDRWLPTIERVRKYLHDFAIDFDKMPKMKQWGADVAFAGAVLAPFAVIAGFAAKGIVNLVAAIAALPGAIKAFAKLKSLKWLTGIGALAGVGLAISQNWERVAPAWNRAKEAAGKLVRSLGNLFGIDMSGFDLGKIFEGLDLDVVNLIAKALNATADGLERLSVFADKLKSGGVQDGAKSWRDIFGWLMGKTKAPERSRFLPPKPSFGIDPIGDLMKAYPPLFSTDLIGKIIKPNPSAAPMVRDVMPGFGPQSMLGIDAGMSGGITAQLEGRADLQVNVKVEGPGQITGLTPKDDGKHIRLNAGTGMADVMN